jgi:NADH-quinone oxidoreductase subunit C
MTWPVTPKELAKLGKSLASGSGKTLTAAPIAFGEITFTAPAAKIVEALAHLRDAGKFEVLIDVTGVDYPERARRFDVVYHLLSMSRNLRVRVKAELAEDEPIASVTGVYPTADWYEREAFDMYGIFFEGHPDLRRILTDYGFHGHPLRKDFPMTGYVEVRYDDELKRVVYEPVKSVEWRNWDFLSPWEGAEPGFAPIPGDEKAKPEPKS